MSETSYSLSDSKGLPLDKKLDFIFNRKKKGFYIELGAFDGITQSNTCFFELNRDWKGILIEPSKSAFELCCKNRPNSIVVNCCCVSNAFNSNTLLGDFNSTLMSSVNGARLKSNDLIEVKAKTLEKILDENISNDIEIDLLSLDTEGYELHILQGLNLDKYRPRYLLIEIYATDYDKILSFLQCKNYILHSNFTNYNKINSPIWDGTHNDFLFYDNSKILL
jgi:FkbM family methyltransferase